MRAQELTTSAAATDTPARQWINKIYDEFYEHPFNPRHRVMTWGQGDDQELAIFELAPVFGKPTTVDIKWFQAYPQRQGIGRRAMQRLQQLAQADGITLTLYPWNRGEISQSKLTKIYRGMGFQPATPGSKDLTWQPQQQSVAEVVKMPPTKNSSQGMADWAYQDAKDKKVPLKGSLRGIPTEVYDMGDHLRVFVKDDQGPVLYLALDKFLDGFKSGAVAVEPRGRGKNLAVRVYQAASDTFGRPIYSDTTQTDASRIGIWQKLITTTPGRVVGYDQRTQEDLPLTATDQGPAVRGNQPVYTQRTSRDLFKPVSDQNRSRTRLLKLLPNRQGLAEGSLNESLSSMVAQDQAERDEYKQFVKSQAGGDWSKGAKLYAQLKKRPSNDIFGDKQRLNQFMKMKFDFDKFTDDDWNNYWLLAQHCDMNRNFQKQALSIIKKYHGADSLHYKYLYDRISCAIIGTQKYGTQSLCDKDHQELSEQQHQDYMAGHCHVMAIALKLLHPDWQIRAHIGWDDDEAEDHEYRVDHVYIVAPDGSAYDCRGKFDNEDQLVGPDNTGGIDTQYVDLEFTDIKQLISRGELKQFTKQDIVHATEFAKQIVKENFADGKKPGRKGLAKRMGVPTTASVSRLRQIAKSSTGERARMAHWLANMKSGKKKAK